MRAKYVLSEVMIGLWRNVTMTVAMIITMAVSLTMLGASLVMYQQINTMRDVFVGDLQVQVAPTDVGELGNLTRTGAEQLRRAGMNVDLQELDFANVVRRRNNQGPPDKGGYNMFCTLIDRSLPNVHPLGNLAIRADGKEPINGWANSPRIEELRAAWLDTTDLEQQKRICVDLQKQLWEDVPFIPMGEYWQATAYRKDLTDVLPGCFATFYGVRRA